MDAILTRCPSCATAFRVKAHVLNRAAGKVRCGSCLGVFDAVEHELLPLPSATVASKPEVQLATPLMAGEAGNSGLTANQALQQAREQSLNQSSAFAEATLDLRTGAITSIDPDQPRDSYGIFSLDDDDDEPEPESPSLSLFFGLADDDSADDNASDLDIRVDIGHQPAPIHPAPDDDPLVDNREQHEPSHDLGKPPQQPAHSDPLLDDTPWWTQDFVFADDAEADASQEASPNADELDSEALADLAQGQGDSDAASLDLFFHQHDNDGTADSDLMPSTALTQSSSDLDFINLPADESLSECSLPSEAMTLAQPPAAEDEDDPDAWAYGLLDDADETNLSDALDSEAALAQDAGLPTDLSAHEWHLELDSELDSAQAEQQPLADSLATPPTPPVGEAILLPNVRDDDLLLEQRPRSHWRWTGVAIVLLMLALSQYLWYARDRWQHQPQLAGVYQQLCQWVSCDQPLASLPQQIRLQRLDVRQNPQQPGLVDVVAVLHNQATVDQTWPVLQLRFVDRQGRMVSLHLLTRDDYLQFSSPALAAGERVQLHVQVENPGPDTDAQLIFLSP